MTKRIKQALDIKPTLMTALLVIVALGAGYGIAQATFVTEKDVILAPLSVIDDEPGATNDHQQAFSEAQRVTLPTNLRCDNGVTLQAGEIVNSHMIFYNTPGIGITTDANRLWEFENEIICVMSNGNGIYQAESNHILGSPTTEYPGTFDGHGLEDGDSYSVSGNTITVTMRSDEPGDWIRVVTRWTAPPDSTAPVVTCAPDPADKGGGGILTLSAEDNRDETLDIFVIDTGSNEEFGPLLNNSTLKYNESKGGTPKLSEKGGGADYMIHGNGPAVAYAIDAAGNRGSANCLTRKSQ